MDKRAVSVAVVLVISAICGASVLVSETDGSESSQTITGINGTDSITISVDPANDTLMMRGYDESGVEVCWMKMDIQER